MRILTIDTSGQTEIVGVVDAGEVIASVESPAGRGQPRTLLAAIDEALTASSTAVGDIDGIAVSIGPGRFSGLRVGLATAKGLVADRQRPIWGISTLESIAESARGAGAAGSRVFAAADARRGEVYGALFEQTEEETMRRVTEDAALPPVDAARWAAEQAGGGKVLFVGPGAVAYRNEIISAVEASAVFVDAGSLRSVTEVLAELAERSGVAGAADPAALEPVYIRGAVG